MSHVDGNDDGVGYGVSGNSQFVRGVRGTSGGGVGVFGLGVIGVEGRSETGPGVYGESPNRGVQGRSADGFGVYGESVSSEGVQMVWRSSRISQPNQAEKVNRLVRLENHLELQ